MISSLGQNNPLYIIGLGVVTAIGTNAPMSAASARANISGVKESYLIDQQGEPILLSKAEFIAEEIRGLNRFLALAAPAAKEALLPLMTNPLITQKHFLLPIFLGLPSPRPGLDSDIAKTLLHQLEVDIHFYFAEQRVVLAVGHAAGLMGIEQAVQWIRPHEPDLALIGGIDSYYDPDTLEWLDNLKRLHSTTNLDGFIPGEGAGFCLLASAAAVKHYRLKPLARLVSTAVATEPYPYFSQGVCIGAGLTEVFHQVLAKDEKNQADWTISDLNGESFRASEWMYAYLRTAKQHRSPLKIWHPADCWGDVGAASGPLLINVAVHALNKNYGRGTRPLIWCASDEGQRAAILLESIDNGRY